MRTRRESKATPRNDGRARPEADLPSSARHRGARWAHPPKRERPTPRRASRTHLGVWLAVLLHLLLSGGGGVAANCPDGSTGLTPEVYEGGDFARVTCIPDEAFQKYEGVVVLNGLQYLESIEYRAFYYFKGKLTISGDYPALESIGEEAFYNAGTAASAVAFTTGLPSLKSFEYNAFGDFSGKLSISGDYPALESIGGWAFYNAGTAASTVAFTTGLRSLKSIGGYAFWYFSGKLTISGDYPALESIGDDAFSYDGTAASAVAFTTGLRSLKIIGDYAFNRFSGKLTISGDYPALESIGYGAFYNAGTAASAVAFTTGLPSLKSIGDYAFYGFSGKLTISGDYPALESIGGYAFASAGTAASVVAIQCSSPQGLTIGSNASSSFKGNRTQGGEQSRCVATSTVATSTALTTSTSPTSTTYTATTTTYPKTTTTSTTTTTTVTSTTVTSTTTTATVTTYTGTTVTSTVVTRTTKPIAVSTATFTVETIANITPDSKGDNLVAAKNESVGGDGGSPQNEGDEDGTTSNSSSSNGTVVGLVVAIVFLCLLGLVYAFTKKKQHQQQQQHVQAQPNLIVVQNPAFSPAKPSPQQHQHQHQHHHHQQSQSHATGSSTNATYDNAAGFSGGTANGGGAAPIKVHVEDPYGDMFGAGVGSGLYDRVLIDDYASMSPDGEDELDPTNNRFTRVLSRARATKPPEYARLLAAAAKGGTYTQGTLPASEVVRAAITVASKSCGNGKSDANFVVGCIDPALIKGQQLFQKEVAAGILPNPDLTAADITVIHFYTLHTELYSAVNKALRRLEEDPDGAGFDEALPFFPYIDLLITALDKLPAVENKILFRGIKLEMAVLFGTKPIQGKHRFLWPSFTSTTLSSTVLQSSEFLGVGAEHGERTAFQIRGVEGRNISAYSYFGVNGGNGADDEQEVLLLPGACFDTEAKGIVRHPSNKVTEVKAQQLKTVTTSGKKKATTKTPAAGFSSSSSNNNAPVSPYEELYSTLGGGDAEPVYATVSPESFVDGGLWWQPVAALGSAVHGPGESKSSEAPQLQQQSPTGIQGVRMRSNTDWSGQCARGQAGGGKKCNNRAVPGGNHCTGHSCPHAGCTNSKSSTAGVCDEHCQAAAPTTTPPPPAAAFGLSGAKVRGNKANKSGKYGFGGGVKAGVSVYNGFADVDEDEEV